MTAVERLDEIGAHLNAAYKELGEVCTRGPSKRFRMSIPANPERDTDLIIDRALMDATQAGAALRAVLDLHKPVWSTLADGYRCIGCDVPLTDVTPNCPTVATITAALDPS